METERPAWAPPEGPTASQEAPHPVLRVKAYRQPIRVPWFGLFIGFLIAYQSVPEFNAWVNYQVRSGLRWPKWLAEYAAWWMRQPEGASDA